jgi:hypothetical protein
LIKVEKILESRWNNSSSKYRAVEILWLDAIAVCGDEWSEHENAYFTKPAKTLTLGYVVKETSDYITVVGLINNSHLSHGICIPKGMVEEIRELNAS